MTGIRDSIILLLIGLGILGLSWGAALIFPVAQPSLIFLGLTVGGLLAALGLLCLLAALAEHWRAARRAAPEPPVEEGAAWPPAPTVPPPTA